MRAVGGVRGLPGGLIGGFVVDAVLQGLADWNACLSGKELAYNMAVAGLTGVLAGLVGAAAFAGVASVAIPIVGVSLGGTAAIASGAGAALFAGNLGPIANWRKDLLITPSSERLP
jgi:hypothetical protein